VKALPGFARRSFEQEWQEVSDIQSIDFIPPLAFAYLMRCERFVCDLLNRNYEGLASSHLEKCVSKTAIDIRARVIASRIYEGDASISPAKRTA
jgi:hypothetical protein